MTDEARRPRAARRTTSGGPLASGDARPSDASPGNGPAPSAGVGPRATSLLAVAVLLLDLTSKGVVFASVEVGEVRPWVVPLRNEGTVLGVLDGPSVGLVVLGIGVLGAFVALCAALVGMGRVPGWVLGVLLGGVAANLVDRAATGAVHDWLALGGRGGIAVNVADLAVLAALAGYGVGLIRSRPLPPEAATHCSAEDDG